MCTPNYEWCEAKRKPSNACINFNRNPANWLSHWIKHRFSALLRILKVQQFYSFRDNLQIRLSIKQTKSILFLFDENIWKCRQSLPLKNIRIKWLLKVIEKKRKKIENLKLIFHLKKKIIIIKSVGKRLKLNLFQEKT